MAPSPGRHITSLTIRLKFYHFIIHTLALIFASAPLPFGSRRSSTEDVTGRGLWPFSQVPYREPFVAVDCLELLRQAQEKDGNSGD